MDILTNPLIGYGEVQYFELLRNIGEENKNYLCGNMVDKNPVQKNDNFPKNNYKLINCQNKKNINRYSKISQAGLDMRVKKEKPKIYKVKKVKIPLWTYFNKLD